MMVHAQPDPLQARLKVDPLGDGSLEARSSDVGTASAVLHRSEYDCHTKDERTVRLGIESVLS